MTTCFADLWPTGQILRRLALPVTFVLLIEFDAFLAHRAGGDNALEEVARSWHSFSRLIAPTGLTDAFVQRRRDTGVACDDNTAPTHRSNRNMVKIWEGHHRKLVAPSLPAGVTILSVSFFGQWQQISPAASAIIGFRPSTRLDGLFPSPACCTSPLSIAVHARLLDWVTVQTRETFLHPTDETHSERRRM